MSDAPQYSESTERFWDELPEIHRIEDERQPLPVPGDGDPGGYPLKRWISAITDQLDAVRDVLERADYLTADEGEPGDTSDLVDPDRADVAWLPWLAQLVGVQVSPSLSAEAQRAAIRGSVSGFRGGTKRAIADAARAELTGSRSIEIYDHSSDVGKDAGGPWDVLMITRSSETPPGLDLVAAVIAKGAKPAGVMLYHRMFETSWDVLEAQRPTWVEWESATWTEIEETGLNE